MVSTNGRREENRDYATDVSNLERLEMKDELIARDARGRALEGSKYKVLTTKDRVDITQELKQLYFHAGRASAGARDYLAIEAYKNYSKREEQCR